MDIVWTPPTPDEELAEWREFRAEGLHMSVWPERGRWQWDLWRTPAFSATIRGSEPTREQALAAAEACARRMGMV